MVITHAINANAAVKFFKDIFLVLSANDAIAGCRNTAKTLAIARTIPISLLLKFLESKNTDAKL